MNKSEITKLLLLRGASADLPENLDEGQFAYTQDQGRLFVGQSAYGDVSGRVVFPFQNLEVLTENSIEVFSAMQGARIRSSQSADYYEATINTTGSGWAPIEILRDGIATLYTVEDISNVMLRVVYSLHAITGAVVRKGEFQVRHFEHPTNPREPMLEDSGISTRQPGSYDPRVAFAQTCLFRFRVVNPVSAPSMVFEYSSTGTEALTLRFRVDRPEPQVYIQAPATPQVYPPTLPPYTPTAPQGPPSN